MSKIFSLSINSPVSIILKFLSTSDLVRIASVNKDFSQNITDYFDMKLLNKIQIDELVKLYDPDKTSQKSLIMRFLC